MKHLCLSLSVQLNFFLYTLLMSCSNDGLGPISDPQLAQDNGDMVAHRPGAEYQAIGNLGIVAPLGSHPYGKEFPFVPPKMPLVI